MTAGFSTNTTVVRVVVLGNYEIDISNVIKYAVGCWDLRGENVGQCVLYEIEQAGTKIIVVETPGWNSMEQTPESIKKSIRRNVSLCPPGPQTLFLGIPVIRDEDPSGDIKAAKTHMELLSGHVWKHNIVQFACDDGVGEFDIKACIQKAKKVLEKCKGRTCILKRYSNISEILKKIEDLVEENCGDVFTPQTYYELFKWKTQDLRCRRGLEWNPPDRTKVKPDFVNDPQALLMHYFKQIIVIVLAVFGALLGTVAGAEYGVSGACAGLFLRSILAVFLSFLVFKLAENRTN